MTELLDWVEKEAKENINHSLQITEALAKEASITITAIIAGIGACIAYLVQAIESSAELTNINLAVLILTVWLMTSGSLLIIKCILTKDIHGPANSPKNLYQKEYKLADLREQELLNIQQRIEHNRDRNYKTALWLDRCRLMVVVSPLVTILAFSLAAYYTNLSW